MNQRFSLEHLFEEIDIGHNLVKISQEHKTPIVAAEFMALEDSRGDLFNVIINGRRIGPDDLSEIQLEIIEAILNGVNIKLVEREKAGRLHGKSSFCQALVLDGVFESVIYDYSIKKNWMLDNLMMIWGCCVLCPSHYQYFIDRSSSGDTYYKHKEWVDGKAAEGVSKQQKSVAGSKVDPIIPLYERWLDKGGLSLKVGKNPYKQFIADIDSKCLRGAIRSKDRKMKYKKRSATIKKDLKLIYAFEAWYQEGGKDKDSFISKMAGEIGRESIGILQNINELIEHKNKIQNH